jgi:hypothetical protein
MQTGRLETLLGEDEIGILLPIMLPIRPQAWRLEGDVLAILDGDGAVIHQGTIGSLAKARLQFSTTIAVIEFEGKKPKRDTDIKRVRSHGHGH